MRELVIVSLMFLCSSVVAADFNGTWYYQVSSKDINGGFTHQIDLVQKGKKVCGRWWGGNQQKVWNGYLYGEIRGHKLYAFECTEPNFNPDNPGLGDCPDHLKKPDIYEIRHGRLYYIRFNNRGAGTGYSVYAVLERDSKSVSLFTDSSDDEEFIKYCSQHSNVLLQGTPASGRP